MKMRISKYISVLLAFCIAVISCEREDGPAVQEDGRPIVFTAESEWPGITKADLADRDDLIAGGFRVWGNWHKDPDDNSGLEYKTEIFGTEGTLVSYVEDTDIMMPHKSAMWHRGYYAFTAIYPDSFAGTATSTFSKTTGNETVLNYSDVLTIAFGDGFNLAEEQTDLMYAFANANNSRNQASSVTLSFQHAFAALDVRLTHNGARVSKVSLYGIHETVTGDLQFTHRSNGDSKTAVVTSNFGDLLTGAPVSTAVDPYYEAEYTQGQGFTYTDETIAIVDDLLVFPETLSVTTALTIAVELQYNGQSKVFTATIDDGEWTSGGTYVYKIVVDTSKFDTTE